MLMDYLVRCGVFLQLFPPAAGTVTDDPNADLVRPAIVEQAFTEPLIHTVETVPPALNEISIDQILEIREVTGTSPLIDAEFGFTRDRREFEEILRSRYGQPGAVQPAQAAKSTDADTVSLLRESSETLDRVANQMERQRRYSAADELRQLSDRLRHKARALD